MHASAAACSRRLRSAGFVPLLAAAALVALPGGAVGATSAHPDLSSHQECPGYETVLHEESLMLSMRDGIRLATDIYRPAREGTVVEEPLPILLHRTPYDKSSSGRRAQLERFVECGYVVVIQDTRGRYASEGVFSKYHEYDALDGHDTVEQLARLPYSDGQVGMWGTSYGAHTQADAAKLSPEGLATLVLNMGGISDGWDHMVRWHGAFEQYQFAWAFGQLRGDTEDPVVREMLEVEGWEEWLHAVPLIPGQNPLSVSPNFEEYYFNMVRSGDARHWKGLGANWVEYYDQTADIPMLHLGGWYDLFARGTVDNFEALASMKEGPIRLIVGPWTHGDNDDSYAGDVEFGAEAAIEDFSTDFHLRWFDHFLKGESTGVEEEPAVQLFVMGTGDGHRDENGRLFHGGYWRGAEDWPLPGTERVRLYFHEGGGLERDPPEAEEASTTYTFDPRSPVPSIGGAYMFHPGGFDQREREDAHGSEPPYLPLGARHDVVVFETEPLEEDVEVVGPIEVTLHVSSTARDTDFTAKLVDVYPPSMDFPTGYALNLTDGILRARYRNSPDRQELMEPGEVYELTVKLFPTANRFKKGHRIRVDVSSSNFPKFDVNPNTGEALGSHRRMIEADNTIHHDRIRASHVVLPVVPTGGP